jgi:hypothetical protein
MTLSRERLSFTLQVTGLAAAIAGVLATPFFGLAAAMQWLAAGIVAVGLDVVSIRSRSDTRAMLAQLGKLAVLLAGIALFPTSTDTAGGGVSTAVIPPDLGPILLLLSVLPSAAGAMVRRTDAPPVART